MRPDRRYRAVSSRSARRSRHLRRWSAPSGFRKKKTDPGSLPERSFSSRRKRRRLGEASSTGRTQSYRPQQGRRVHHGLARVCAGRGYHATNDRNSLRFDRDMLGRFPIAGYKSSTIDEIAWWIPTYREFRKEDQARACGFGAAGVVNDLGGIAGEVPNRRVNLSQRNLHSSSVKPARGSCTVPERDMKETKVGAICSKPLTPATISIL